MATVAAAMTVTATMTSGQLLRQIPLQAVRSCTVLDRRAGQRGSSCNGQYARLSDGAACRRQRDTYSVHGQMVPLSKLMRVFTDHMMAICDLQALFLYMGQWTTDSARTCASGRGCAVRSFIG